MSAFSYVPLKPTQADKQGCAIAHEPFVVRPALFSSDRTAFWATDGHQPSHTIPCSLLHSTRIPFAVCSLTSILSLPILLINIDIPKVQSEVNRTATKFDLDTRM